MSDASGKAADAHPHESSSIVSSIRSLCSHPPVEWQHEASASDSSVVQHESESLEDIRDSGASTQQEHTTPAQAANDDEAKVIMTAMWMIRNKFLGPSAKS